MILLLQLSIAVEFFSYIRIWCEQCYSRDRKSCADYFLEFSNKFNFLPNNKRLKQQNICNKIERMYDCKVFNYSFISFPSKYINKLLNIIASVSLTFLRFHFIFNRELIYICVLFENKLIFSTPSLPLESCKTSSYRQWHKGDLSDLSD